MTAKRLKEIMSALHIDKRGLAALTGASVRTVEGWLAGRTVGKITARAIEGMAKR